MPRLDGQRFELLVREHHTAVFRSAHRLLRDPGAAADVAQDVFVRVLEGKVRLQASESERASLCWLATRLATNSLRARRRRDMHEENAMKRTTDRESDDPAIVAHDADLLRTVQRLIDELPRDLQVPLQMRCQDELTLAAIGTALRLPESTVHDRVQRALHRLRSALAGRGVTLALAGLGELVARADSGAAPADLQSRLLGLSQRAAAGAFAVGHRLVLTAAASVLAAGLAVAAWAPWRAGESSATAAGTVTATARVDAAASVVAQDPPPAPVQRERAGSAGTNVVPPREAPVGSDGSTFVGTVHDAAAWPVAGARVLAFAAGGLKPFQLGATTTDAQGSFRLEVGTSDLDPRRIRLRIVEDSQTLLETDELTLPRAADAAPLRLVLPAGVGTATSKWELSLVVRADDGSVLGGVPVALWADGKSPLRIGWTPPEVGGKTAADGSIVLRGRTLGGKRLFVDGRELGRRSHVASMTIDKPGQHRSEVSLAAGRELTLRITSVDDTPLEWRNVWAEEEATGLSHRGEDGDAGLVVLRGLGDGTYTLHVGGPWEFSPCLVRGARAGSEPLALRLKRRSDLRDIGDHMAELHGELVDAATGAVVELGSFAVDVLPLRPGDSTLAADRLIPRGPVQRAGSGETYTRFDEVGLEAGRYGLIVEVPGYARTVVECEVRDREVRGGMRIPLQRGNEVRGRVVAADGRGVRRVHVFVLGTGSLADACMEQWRTRAEADRDRMPEPSHLVWSTWTADDGSFVLTDMPASVAVRVVARHAGGFGFVPVSMPPVGNVLEGVTVTLSPR